MKAEDAADAPEYWLEQAVNADAIEEINGPSLGC
jgi:hypothetical protein